MVIADVAWLEVGRTGADPADVLGTATAEPAVADALEQLTGLAELLDQSPAASRGERLVVLERLAVVAALAGDVDAAVRWQRRLADESPEDRLEPDVALVDLLEAAGRVDEALAANREVVATLEADRREPDPRLLVPLQVQQRLLEAAGERREARRVKKRIRKLERTLR